MATEAQIEASAAALFTLDGLDGSRFATADENLRKSYRDDARAIIEASQRTLPEFRCDRCDNGIDQKWLHCAWCGGPQTWPAPPDLA